MNEGRKERRNSEQLQVLLSSPALPLHVEQASTENISSYGMRVRTGRPFEQGTIVLVKSSQGELWARARVVYCESLQNKTFGLGLEFLARTEAFLMRDPSLVSRTQRT
jgi:PilZ domain